MSSRVKAVKTFESRVPVKAKKVVEAESSKSTHWILDFGLFALIAVWSAYYNGIWDCDESMNYFEPLHNLLFGYGLQTWEYRFVAKISRTISRFLVFNTCLLP